MKQALCIKSIDDLANLTNGNAEHIETQLVDREICEKVENGFLQVIPYVVFFTIDPSVGKMKVIQYLRAAKGGEEQLANKTSVGFGGHIDDISELDITETVTAEGVADVYKMDINNLIKSCLNTAEREVFEELGIKMSDKEYINVNFRDCAFFMGDQNGDDVHKVHVGLIIPIELSEENYVDFVNGIVPNLAEIADIGDLGLNFNEVINTFNLDKSISDLIYQLRQQTNIEDWSEKTISYILAREINKIVSLIDYADLINVYHHKVALMQAEDAEQQSTLDLTDDTEAANSVIGIPEDIIVTQEAVIATPDAVSE
ncbi:MAG: hypothetical protein ACD_33C00045G0012 [uncultured bacterium]|nr:MAG: hypothetical protein ACD_33C00045G0012 [uncultured bacterium]